MLIPMRCLEGGKYILVYRRPGPYFYFFHIFLPSMKIQVRVGVLSNDFPAKILPTGEIQQIERVSPR